MTIGLFILLMATLTLQRISPNELWIYLSAKVAKANGNLQHPTVDRDNIYREFGLQFK